MSEGYQLLRVHTQVEFVGRLSACLLIQAFPSMIVQIYKLFRGKVSFRLKLDWGALFEKRRKQKKVSLFPVR